MSHQCFHFQRSGRGRAKTPLQPRSKQASYMTGRGTGHGVGTQDAAPLTGITSGGCPGSPGAPWPDTGAPRLASEGPGGAGCCWDAGGAWQTACSFGTLSVTRGSEQQAGPPANSQALPCVCSGCPLATQPALQPRLTRASLTPEAPEPQHWGWRDQGGSLLQRNAGGLQTRSLPPELHLLRGIPLALAWACEPGPGMGRPWGQREEGEGCPAVCHRGAAALAQAPGGWGGLCSRKDGTAGGAPGWQLRQRQVGGRGDRFGLGGGGASDT